MEEINKEDGFLICSGILIIVASSFGLIMGINLPYVWFNDFLYDLYYLFPRWLSIIGFAFGITSGVLMIKKRSFALALSGAIVLLILGILPLLWGFVYPIEFLRFSWVMTFYNYGIPIIILSVLSIAFAVASRKSFS
ncbi:MAG: hypothetical protein QXL52_02625 [Nitrososphaerales archaeon]